MQLRLPRHIALVALSALLLTLCTLPLCAAPTGARSLIPWASKSSAAAGLPALTPSCSGGLVYDDGSFESRVQFADASPVDMVMRMELAAVPAVPEQVCVCFTRTGGDAKVKFDLLFYAADGPGSQPGTFLTGVGGLEADNIPIWPQTRFYNLDLRGFPIAIDRQQIFTGVSWDTTGADADVFLCGDDNGGGQQSLSVSTDLGNSFADLRGFFPKLDALGVRAEFASGGGGGGGGSFECVPDETTICLNDGRFEVRVDWKRQSGQTGDGTPVPFGSDDSGMFSFFNSNNWEMLVKVLDGCAVNDHYWVFFAAVTNVEFSLTVTDSTTGVSKPYFNPLGAAADAVTDTEAFAACP